MSVCPNCGMSPSYKCKVAIRKDGVIWYSSDCKDRQISQLQARLAELEGPEMVTVRREAISWFLAEVEGTWFESHRDIEGLKQYPEYNEIKAALEKSCRKDSF